jgi:hypothetical protein
VRGLFARVPFFFWFVCACAFFFGTFVCVRFVCACASFFFVCGLFVRMFFFFWCDYFVCVCGALYCNERLIWNKNSVNTSTSLSYHTAKKNILQKRLVVGE